MKLRSSELVAAKGSPPLSSWLANSSGEVVLGVEKVLGAEEMVLGVEEVLLGVEKKLLGVEGIGMFICRPSKVKFGVGFCCLAGPGLIVAAVGF